jgi:crotonobetainyl-CoA:carnitine CoA-transferase CaiB-like acyl-CoA transferase
MSESPVHTQGALAGLKVLELGEMVAAPYCTKLLADLGADVIKLERPDGGDPARRRGPFPGDAPDPEKSALFLYLNTSKRSLTLDLESEAGRERFLALAARADILVEDRAPGALADLGLGYEVLAARNPGLVVTSITPYGQNGPRCQDKSHHLNLYHSAGHASPFAELGASDARAPSRAGGYLGEYDAGLTASLGTLAAVYGREESGRGQHIDVSKQEAMMCLERVTIGRFANEPDPFSGRGPGGLLKASDGWVMITTLEQHQWEGLVRAMGSPEWCQAEWCRDSAARMANTEQVREHIERWTSGLEREEIYHLAQREGTPAAPVRDFAEVLGWEQARSRDFFRELDHPAAGKIPYPTLPYRSQGLPFMGRAAPRLGEHEAADFGDTAERSRAASEDGESAREQRSQATRGPLAGIRIADFTWAWAGPQGALLLGMLGAEVIKIESRSRLDHARVHSLTAGSLQGGIDDSPVFNDLNLGKRSVTLNLRKPEARELVRQLVSKSDVVLQNMRPGVLDRLKLGYDDLRTVKPDIIMLSSSAVGATGPERTYAGYAPTFACLSGVVSVSGHPDEPPIALSGSVDLRVGTASAFAVLAALVARRRTGEGQNIDLSSTEVMTSMLGDAVVGYALSGRVPERIGNRDASMAPHGCYRCAEEGAWITIAVEDDEEWSALCALIDDPQLAHADFATREQRHRHQEQLDAAIERWTARQAASEAVEALQRAGIAAAPVQTGASLSRDPHILERGVFPAPLLGDNNDYVLGELLGLDAAEIDELVESEIVY